ncbi:hypothetical protein BJV74DRAFT_932356 [Russula compacta]|nr:hypothetical protein BJV74DRAFT_932356 [Russula compacta]
MNAPSARSATQTPDPKYGARKPPGRYFLKTCNVFGPCPELGRQGPTATSSRRSMITGCQALMALSVWAALTGPLVQPEADRRPRHAGRKQKSFKTTSEIATVKGPGEGANNGTQRSRWASGYRFAKKSRSTRDSTSFLGRGVHFARETLSLCPAAPACSRTSSTQAESDLMFIRWRLLDGRTIGADSEGEDCKSFRKPESLGHPSQESPSSLAKHPLPFAMQRIPVGQASRKNEEGNTPHVFPVEETARAEIRFSALLRRKPRRSNPSGWARGENSNVIPSRGLQYALTWDSPPLEVRKQAARLLQERTFDLGPFLPAGLGEGGKNAAGITRPASLPTSFLPFFSLSAQIKGIKRVFLHLHLTAAMNRQIRASSTQVR